MADCKAIEGARAVAMQQRGFSPSVPHLQIYAKARDGGLQHEHAYRVAAAALIDQIDRALCGAEGEPHRAAVKQVGDSEHVCTAGLPRVLTNGMDARASAARTERR